MKKPISIAVAAACLAASQAYADSLVLEEVIVTAQKRASTVKDIAATVNVVSGESIQDFATFSFSELEEQTAGLSLTSPNARNQNIGLRGVSVDPESGIANTVDVYWNDMIVRAELAFSTLYDMERVEVLRGPQGTLQGRTSPAGAVNIITRKANLDAYEGSLQGTVSDNEGLNGQLALNIPLIEGKLGVRVAGVYDQSFSNNVQNLTTGTDDPEQDSQSARVSIGWAPTDTLVTNFTWQNFDRSTDDIKGLDGVDGLGQRPSLSAEDRRSLSGTDDFTDFEFDIYNMDINWEMDNHQLSAVLGYVDSTKTSRQENDRADYIEIDEALTTQGTTTAVESITGEIRFASTDRDFWNYMVGVFYQDQETRTAFNANTTLSPPSPTISFSTEGAIPVDAENLGIFTFNTFDLSDSMRLELGLRWTRFENSRGAVVNFGELNYLPSFLQPIEDATGAISANFAQNFPIDAISPENQDENQDAFTGSLSLRYDMSADVSLYASYARGFRPGGITIVPDPDVVFLPNGEDDLLFDSEESDSIEVGFKGRFLDGRASLNGALFYQQFDGYLGFIRGVQVLDDNGEPVDISGGLIFNGDAILWGTELEGRILLTDNWSAGGAMSYVQAEWDGAESPCNDREPGEVLGFCDIDGQNVSGEPEFSLSLNSEFTLPVAGNEWYLRGLYKYTGETQNQDASAGIGAVTDEFEERHVLNLYTGVRSTDGKWDAGLWVKNALDSDEIVRQTGPDQYDLAATGGSFTQTNVQQERVIGGTVRYNW